MTKLNECYVKYIARPGKRQSLFLYLGFNRLASEMGISFLECKHGTPDVIVINEGEITRERARSSGISKIRSLKKQYPNTPIILLSDKYRQPETDITEQEKLELIGYMRAGVDKILPFIRSKDKKRMLALSIIQEHQRNLRLGRETSLKPQQDEKVQSLYLGGMEIIPERHEVRFGGIIVNNLGRSTMALLKHFAKSSRDEFCPNSIQTALKNEGVEVDVENFDARWPIQHMRRELRREDLPEVLVPDHRTIRSGTWRLNK